MQIVVGDLWTNGTKIATAVRMRISSTTVTPEHDSKLEGTLSTAAVAAKVGDQYQFRANDGRIGQIQIFQIVLPDTAHFTFLGPFERKK